MGRWKGREGCGGWEGLSLLVFAVQDEEGQQSQLSVL